MKIYIIGSSCSGKTTLARNIAAKLAITHIEIDQFWWLPNWQERDVPEFRHNIETKLQFEPDWVIDGNYSKVRDLIMTQADQIIWLNLPFYIILWRSITRTIVRAITRKSVCNGNYERLSALFSHDGMPAWVIRTWKLRRIWGQNLKATDDRVIELKSQKEINTFLENLRKLK